MMTTVPLEDCHGQGWLQKSPSFALASPNLTQNKSSSLLYDRSSEQFQGRNYKQRPTRICVSMCLGDAYSSEQKEIGQARWWAIWWKWALWSSFFGFTPCRSLKGSSEVRCKCAGSYTVKNKATIHQNFFQKISTHKILLAEKVCTIQIHKTYRALLNKETHYILRVILLIRTRH